MQHSLNWKRNSLFVASHSVCDSISLITKLRIFKGFSNNALVILFQCIGGRILQASPKIRDWKSLKTCFFTDFSISIKLVYVKKVRLNQRLSILSNQLYWIQSMSKPDSLVLDDDMIGLWKRVKHFLLNQNCVRRFSFFFLSTLVWLHT